MSWTYPSPLKNYKNAPNVQGEYEIGTSEENGNFETKYLGYAMGDFSNISSELNWHYNLRGNLYVTKNNRDQLYARWKEHYEPDPTIARLLRKQRDYPWNERKNSGPNSDRQVIAGVQAGPFPWSNSFHLLVMLVLLLAIMLCWWCNNEYDEESQSNPNVR